MNWMERIAEERRKREQSDDATEAERHQRLAKDSAVFQEVKKHLCPILESILQDLQQRTGIVLNMETGATDITVRGIPTTRTFKLDESRDIAVTLDDHRLVVSVLDEPNRVWIELVQDERYPFFEDEGYAGLKGIEMHILSGPNRLEPLIKSDIHLLVEWLARKVSEGKAPGRPRISGLKEQEEKEFESVRPDIDFLIIVATIGAVGLIGSFLIGMLSSGYLLFAPLVGYAFATWDFENARKQEGSFDWGRWFGRG